MSLMHGKMWLRMSFLNNLDIVERSDIGLWFSGMVRSLLGFGKRMILAVFQETSWKMLELEC